MSIPEILTLSPNVDGYVRTTFIRTLVVQSSSNKPFELDCPEKHLRHMKEILTL